MPRKIDFSILRRRFSKYAHLQKPLVLTLSLLSLVFVLYLLRQPLDNLFRQIIKGSSAVISFTKDPASTLESTNDRTNLLLLGKGGEGHIGADLTDSIVIISFYHPTKKLTLISIPRDIWVESMRAKINTAYYYGKLKQPDGGGLILARSAVGEITGLPIHYAFALDFEGFKQAIDLVGGIDLTVDRTFDDFKYPLPGKEDVLPETDRYEHLHFDAGPQHLDGSLALKFVRSRMAEGDEGTDFARSARQQKVLLAFKDKLLSQQTLLSPQKISELLDIYQQYIDTDLELNEYAAFAKLALSVDTQNIKSIPLTTGDDETNGFAILENPRFRAPYDGQYVLIAKDGNQDALRQYIDNQLNR